MVSGHTAKKFESRRENAIREETLKEIIDILEKLPTCQIIIMQNKWQISYELRQRKHPSEKGDVLFL